MPIEAIGFIREMTGSSRPKLLNCQGQVPYVVKFQRNTLGGSVPLASDYLATKLGRWLGLRIPQCDVIKVPPHLKLDDRPYVIHSAEGTEGSDLHFGSQFVGGNTGGSLHDILPPTYLTRLSHLKDFAGMMVFDKWCANDDTRQVVFHRLHGTSEYTPHFIDHDRCFKGADWTFPAEPQKGLYPSGRVYAGIRGWVDLEPYLTRLFDLRKEDVLGMCAEIPPLWYGRNPSAIESLIQRLLDHRLRVYQLLDETIAGAPVFFPSWKYPVVSYPAHNSWMLPARAHGHVRC